LLVQRRKLLVAVPGLLDPALDPSALFLYFTPPRLKIRE